MNAKRLPPSEPQFSVLFDREGRVSVFFNGQPIRNVRAVDYSTTLTIEDTVRSRISIELVGEVIPIVPPPAPDEAPDETK